MGAEQPGLLLPSSKHHSAAGGREGAGRDGAFGPGEQLLSGWHLMFRVMLDNAQSADKTVAQVLGVYATKTFVPEVLSLYLHR